jgi:hypothetical protein
METSCYTAGPAISFAQSKFSPHTHPHKEKMSAIRDTKEIKMKIQEPSGECNTKYTAKPCSESVPTIFLCGVFAISWLSMGISIICI